MRLQFLQRSGSAAYWALLTFCFLVVFAIDLLLPYGYIAAALYVIPVFLTVLTGRVAWVGRTTIAAVVATLLGFLNTPGSAVAPDASQHAFTRVTIAVMILAAGAAGSLLIVRSNRLTAVSGELSSTSDELEKQAKLIRAASQIGKIAGWSLAREEGSSIVWSEAVEPIFGLEPGARSLPSDALAFVPDSRDRDRLKGAAFDCLRDGTPFVETFRAMSTGGRLLWATVMGEATRNDLGRIVGIAGALQDVTLWKEAEATAATQRRRFTQFANSLPSIIWTAEPSGEIDYFNDAV
ncbi:MAG TPA: PAS domain-containing protein, partial [Demequinaceae bacterium]